MTAYTKVSQVESGSTGSLLLPAPPSSLSSSSSSESTSLNTQAASPSPSPTSLALPSQQTDFAFDLSHNLVSASSNVTTLPSLPDNCVSFTQPGANLECPSPGPSNAESSSGSSNATATATGAMTAYNITFDDCGSPFTVCLCNTGSDNSSITSTITSSSSDTSDTSTTNNTQSNPMSLNTILDRFSRVPVGLRRYVNTVVVVPAPQDNPDPRAYTLKSGDIHLFGDTGVNIWVHESMHAYDFAQDINNPLSSSQGWQDAVRADSCVPDNYSATNAVEDFAQFGVIKMYALANQGTLPQGMQPECMYNQLRFMDQLPLFNATTLFGNTCHIPHQNKNGARHTTSPPFLNKTSKMPISFTGESGTAFPATITGLMSTVAPVPTTASSASDRVVTSRLIRLELVVTFSALLALFALFPF
ncbi:hypothetical protein D9758_005477 [Tetrapyrgos nigripes]|uniref:Conidiation-specific protein 13 n=1 Tax=Tetrapyrgos nigripes TaxID=182062 RepID=A0A8H5GIE0_9AGAR|nr:hypothetical protein D9758_005477 [Tetrapyrgos nigripes]